MSISECIERRLGQCGQMFIGRALAARSLAVVLVLVCASLACSPAAAQRDVHYWHSTRDMAPGEIARRQLVRGGPLEGYFQPVEITVPEGASISLAQDGGFTAAHTDKTTVGMLIGHVYRLKVTGIPLHEGFEVYPTVEVVDRLYPPPGLARRFPIPIQLTKEELIYALNGQFVTRVIYLENPRAALPVRDNPQLQRVFEVGRQDDPLRIADELGRPMAILRMGSRIPEHDGSNGRFTYGTPPFVEYSAEQDPGQAGGRDATEWTPSVPRIDAPVPGGHH
jgi:hypothetical protein